MSDRSPVAAALYDPAVRAARQVLYRYLSLAFSDPRGRCWASLANPELQNCIEMAATLIRREPAASGCELGPGERPLESLDPSRMISSIPGTTGELNSEYERVFGLLVSGCAPPYETEYVNGKLVFQRSQNLAEIAGFYHAFGVEVSGQCPDRQDHISLELEFMAVLIGLEIQAAESDATDRVQICRDAQQQFLEKHLAWWIPAFARLLRKEHPDGYYASACEFLTAFLPAERSLLGVATPNIASAPSLLERPEECEGCQIHV